MNSIFRSPTMAGGLLAAHREYFFEIGGYGTLVRSRWFSFDLSSRLDEDMEVSGTDLEWLRPPTITRTKASPIDILVHRFGVVKIWRSPSAFGCVVAVWNSFRALVLVISFGRAIPTTWPAWKVLYGNDSSFHLVGDFSQGKAMFTVETRCVWLKSGWMITNACITCIDMTSS